MTSANPDWQFSPLNVNDSQSLPALTLEPLYAADLVDSDLNNLGYVLYNDQADNNITLIMGHSKGVILFNEKSAVWLVHSIPHYPPVASAKEYFIRPGQCVYGQSMLCMSFNFDQLEIIGKQLLFSYPQVYDSFIPEKLKTKELEPLLSVIRGEHVTQSPWSSVAELTTAGGERMISFAKFTNFEDDLYAGLVAPSLKSSLLTETWNNGAGTLKSNCSSAYQVNNIEKLKLDILGLKFSVHNDHSKWAVTSSDDIKDKDDDHVKMACVGDINRQEDQYKRGGGTVCFADNIKVWSKYFDLVDDVEQCEWRLRRKLINIKKYQFGKFSEKIVIL